MRSSLLVAGATTLAAATGVLGALALGASSQEPTSTTTINVGGTGPQGPPGPPGPAGTFDCGTGWHVGVFTFVQPGEGPATMKGCVKN
jgi:hypothetical protein